MQYVIMVNVLYMHLLLEYLYHVVSTSLVDKNGVVCNIIRNLHW